jgi:hypothetical protein
LTVQKIKSIKRPFLPLSINDLVVHQQKRVFSPSPGISAQYHRRLRTEKTSTDEGNKRKDSYQFDTTANLDKLPSEVRALLDNMIKQYDTTEYNLAMQSTRNVYEGLTEDEVAQLVENAIEAVERFDRENNIGDRKLQNKKTVNDRLTEFFKYSGHHGVGYTKEILLIFISHIL